VAAVANDAGLSAAGFLRKVFEVERPKQSFDTDMDLAGDARPAPS
jgi:hypothetical protein